MKIIRRCVTYSLTALSLTALLFVFMMAPQPLAAHSVLPPDGTIMLVEGKNSGPYTITASQSATDEFIVLEVEVTVDDGDLPADTSVEIAAISSRTGQTLNRGLLRHHDTFIARLPLLAEAWRVDINIEGVAGNENLSTSVIPYRAQAETPPLVRSVVLGAPFVLILVVLVVYRRFGISLAN